MITGDITTEVFIEVMLCHVPFDGWTETTMRHTADELGMSARPLMSVGGNDGRSVKSSRRESERRTA